MDSLNRWRFVVERFSAGLRMAGTGMVGHDGERAPERGAAGPGGFEIAQLDEPPVAQARAEVVVEVHAVPYPARVCVAGEKTFPDREPNANWSLTQHAAVITGPKKRVLYRSLQDLSHPRPVYEYTPKLALGPGVEMQPEWQADIAAGRCELAN